MHNYSDLKHGLPDPPSTLVQSQSFAIFNDVLGLQSRDRVGMSQLMFETDYPHSDSAFPHSIRTAENW